MRWHNTLILFALMLAAWGCSTMGNLMAGGSSAAPSESPGFTADQLDGFLGVLSRRAQGKLPMLGDATSLRTAPGGLGGDEGAHCYFAAYPDGALYFAQDIARDMARNTAGDITQDLETLAADPRNWLAFGHYHPADTLLQYPPLRKAWHTTQNLIEQAGAEDLRAVYTALRLIYLLYPEGWQAASMVRKVPARRQVILRPPGQPWDYTVTLALDGQGVASVSVGPLPGRSGPHVIRTSSTYDPRRLWPKGFVIELADIPQQFAVNLTFYAQAQSIVELGDRRPPRGMEVAPLTGAEVARWLGVSR